MNLKLQNISKMSMAFLMALFSVWGWAQVSIGSLPTTYSQNFNTLSTTSSTWSNNSTLLGWYISTTTLPISNGTPNANSSYNTGTTGNSDRSIGALSTGTNHNFGVRLKNNSSQPIESFTVSFTGEQWRQNAAGTLVLSYRVSTTAITSLSTGTFTDIPALNFAAIKTGTAGAIDGDDVSNKTPLTGTLNINIPAGSEIMFRWNKAGSNSPVLSVDDLTIVANAAVTNTPGFSTTGTFSNFSYLQGNGPSSSQSISISGSNLDNTAVTVAAPTNFEVSLTGGNDFADSKTVSYSSGAFTSQNVYARLKSGLASGAYSGNLTISGGGVATASTISLNGNVTAVPIVTGSVFTGNVGVAFSENIQATQTPTSYALANGTTLPLGLNLNTTTGAITGTPTTAGIFTTDITATNTAGTSTAATITTTIVKGNQNVVLANINAVINGPNTTLPATTVENISLNYSSSDTSIASISGNTLSFAGIGSATITAANTGDSNYNIYSTTFTVTVTAVPLAPWEDFELGTKASYAAGNVTSTAGTWRLEDALLGTSASDRKNGSQSVRIQNSGSLQTNFDITSGVGKVTINHAKYGTDGNNSWVLKASTDGGTTWMAFTSSIINTTSTTLNAEEITVNLAGNVRLRIEKTTSGGRLNIDDIYVTSYSSANTWNGSVWSNGNPVATQPVIIDGAYAGTGFAAQSITVNANNTLTVNSGETFTTGNMTNNGNVVVNDGGNFIQTVGGTYTAGLGSSFLVNRNTASVPSKYVFWASPIKDQNVFGIYPALAQPGYVMTYNTATNFYDVVSNADSNFISNAGKGYSVKMPLTAISGVSFGGLSKIPNNGTVNVALQGTLGGLSNYNLIGNPYPSNLDLNAFYAANNTAIESTLWFWDNTTGNVTTQTGNTSVNVGYATVNAASGTWAEAPGTQSYNSVALNGVGNIAKTGQGFIVKSLNAATVSFTNAMRASSNGVTLNKNGDADTGKFWIKLTTSYGNTVTQAVTYSQGAADSYDVYDSKAMGMGSDAFYSLAGAEKLIIQGRAPFNVNDVVSLGTKHFESGNFTVSLSHKEGLFTNGQAIYLHDKSTGTYTNLQNQTYSFTANAGEFADRFEIVYKLDVLATSEVQKDAFEVYRDGEDFFMRNNKNIENVKVFDAAGRKVQNIDSNSKLVRIKLESKGLYIIKAKSAGKEYSKKVIK